MTMAKTIQLGYEKMRVSDITTDDTQLDGETAGYTYHYTDRPIDSYSLGPEANAAEIIFPGSDVSDGNNFSAKLYGYRVNDAPAEFLADISGTAGLARIADVTTALYTDTLVIASQGHIKTLSVADSANDRVAKLAFDCVGFQWLYVEFYDVSANWNAYIATF